MNTGDVRIQDCPYHAVPTIRWNTKAAATALNPGEVVKMDIGSNGIQYAKLIADGDGTTSQIILGVVKGGPSKSGGDSVTASADGLVDVYVPLPGIVYAAKASVATLANTQAKINALIGKRVAFDLSVLATGQVTVDTGSDADAVTNGVMIVGGNYLTSEIYFVLRSNVLGLVGNITT
jgi:hypothetical protein